MPDGLASFPIYGRLNVQGALDFLGDAQALQDMLPILCATLEKDVPAVTLLLAQGERHAAARCLHSLKGFVPVFCHEDLEAELVSVERLCCSADSPGIDAAFDHLAPKLLVLAQEAAHYLVQAG